jgi:PAS domain S-box-containing protein
MFYPANMKKLNVLLVDDKEANLIALAALINRDDINILSTTNPNEALKIAWEHDVAIALVDVQMPDMDGFELVELLKKNPRTKNILVIFVTAISKESRYAVKGLNTGAVDYLYKPLDPFVTAAKVDSFVQLVKMQRELIEKNQELENYAIEVTNSADIICRIDPKSFRIISVNPAVEKILGFRHDEVLDKGLLDFTEDKGLSVIKYELEKLIKDQDRESAIFEDRFRNFKQETQWLECRVKKTNDMLLLNMSDITVQKNYTNELIRSRDMAQHAKQMKESFLANMSHEIRTPINGIIALNHVLRDTDLSPEQIKILDLVSVSSESLLGVINDILDLSKIEAGKFSIVRSDANVRYLTQSVCNILKFKADEKGISLMVEIADNVPEFIYADSLRINQILMNLLSNAIKFTEKGGVRLSVTASEAQADKIKLAFIVEDSGIGISFDKLEHIFDSFSQAEDNISARYGGTGLGLTITKRLCELKGGQLSVKSMIGKGSVFSFVNQFTVISDSKVMQRQNMLTTIIPFEKTVRVLLAEDNAINQFAAKNVMRKWNVEIDIAETGDTAFEMLKRNDYDIVLMDIYMPGMNGYEATRKIRKELTGEKQRIPIITLSAAVLEGEMSEAKDAGMDDMVSKPFNPVILYGKMKALLEREVSNT